MIKNKLMKETTFNNNIVTVSLADQFAPGKGLEGTFDHLFDELNELEDSSEEGRRGGAQQQFE